MRPKPWTIACAAALLVGGTICAYRALTALPAMTVTVASPGDFFVDEGTLCVQQVASDDEAVRIKAALDLFRSKDLSYNDLLSKTIYPFQATNPRLCAIVP